jgi:poly-gamma-glutamate synthesis protein (capsule biosynthesis protein)
MADSCYRLSEYVLDGMTQQTGIRKMSVLRTDNMSGINWSKVPVTIIEMGFMSNPGEDELMETEDFQNNAAVGIANGIDRFFSEDIDIVLGFAGDFNLDENWATTQHMDSLDNGIEGCISQNLLDKMKSFDYFMLNNEYTYSKRGTPIPGKSYTFRADPERVKILDELGVDVVLLANNHVADYGEEALLDTLTTLESDNIPYVGAGRNISDAAKPHYYSVGDYTIAYCAASCAESYSAKYWTQEATDSGPGILACYNPEIFLRSIEEARRNADYVIANIHWGLEYSYTRDKFQEDLGKRAIDSGADIVIGSHPHVVQGIDFYKERPIFYSLGNYWFNNKDLYSELVYVSLHLSGDHHELTVNDYGLIPCTQYGLYTSSDEDSKEWKDIIAFLNKISYNAVIDDEGKVTEKGRKVQ